MYKDTWVIPKESKPCKDDQYKCPYCLGILLGVLVIVSLFLTGKGLGASGTFARLTAWAQHLVAPGWIENHGYYKWWFYKGAHPLDYYLMWVTLGSAIGGAVSGILAGRNKVAILRGPRITDKTRLLYAFIGGGLVGFGTRLARGCSSSLGITNCGLMSVGGWIFFLAMFAGGFLVAWTVGRRAWQ